MQAKPQRTPSFHSFCETRLLNQADYNSNGRDYLVVAAATRRRCCTYRSVHMRMRKLCFIYPSSVRTTPGQCLGKSLECGRWWELEAAVSLGNKLWIRALNSWQPQQEQDTRRKAEKQYRDSAELQSESGRTSC